MYEAKIAKKKPPTTPPMMAPEFILLSAGASGVHFEASETEPPHVLQASRSRRPPITPLQSTISSAAATATADDVKLQVQVTELLVEE